MTYEDKTLNELLFKEVSMIDDPSLAQFVRETLEVVSPIHAVKAASSTAKYHPRYAAGEGGLVRHIKVVVQILVDLLRATPVLEGHKDVMVAAAILHDMWKYPEGRDDKYTAFDHPFLGMKYCEEHGQPEVGRLIGAHQGIWSTHPTMPNFKNNEPQKFDEWVLHYADYMASRTYLNVDFDETGEIIFDPWAKDRKEKVKEIKESN